MGAAQFRESASCTDFCCATKESFPDSLIVKGPEQDRPCKPTEASKRLGSSPKIDSRLRALNPPRQQNGSRSDAGGNISSALMNSDGKPLWRLLSPRSFRFDESSRSEANSTGYLPVQALTHSQSLQRKPCLKRHSVKTRAGDLCVRLVSEENLVNAMNSSCIQIDNVNTQNETTSAGHNFVNFQPTTHKQPTLPLAHHENREDPIIEQFATNFTKPFDVRNSRGVQYLYFKFIHTCWYVLLLASMYEFDIHILCLEVYIYILAANTEMHGAYICMFRSPPHLSPPTKPRLL